MNATKFLTARNIVIAEAALLLVCLMVPGMREAAAKREAEGAASEIRQVIHAAAEARAQHAEWPEDGKPGSAPESLRPFLVGDTKFDHRNYQLDWDYWRLSEGAASFDRRSEFAGVSITTRDPQLLNLVATALKPERLQYQVGDRATFVLAGPGVE